jgi:hypothetical protein
LRWRPTARITKQEILQKATQWELTNRKDQPISSQAIRSVCATVVEEFAESGWVQIAP